METQAPVPPPIGIRDTVRLACWAWLDRWRYRKLDDVAHTHLTLRLHAQYADGCAAVDEWQVAEEARLRRSIAELDQPSQGETPPQARHRAVAELDGLPESERHRWAQDNREADRQVQQTYEERLRQQRVTVAVCGWEQDLAALPLITATAKERWRCHLLERLAIYTRARLRGFSGPQLSSARIPQTASQDPAEQAQLRVA